MGLSLDCFAPRNRFVLRPRNDVLNKDFVPLCCRDVITRCCRVIVMAGLMWQSVYDQEIASSAQKRIRNDALRIASLLALLAMTGYGSNSQPIFKLLGFQGFEDKWTKMANFRILVFYSDLVEISSSVQVSG